MSNYLIVVLALILLGCTGARADEPQMKVSEVTFTGAGGLVLCGTLVMPTGQTKAPAFLLLPGSGPTDRDGNSGLGITTDILKQIASELASEGVASLRFDKRAIARYRSSWPTVPDELNKFFSYRNFIDDAKAAYRSLRSQPGIDQSRTGILGHSEGGLFALQIASDLSGAPEAPSKLILLSIAGRSLGPVIHEQLKRQVSNPAVPKEMRDKLLEYSDAACAALIAGKPLPPDEPEVLKGLYNPTVVDIVTAYLTIDPAELAKKFTGPVLIVNGRDDTQVSAERDAPVLEKAMKTRAKGLVKLVIVPKASHNLKSTADGNPDAFGGPVVPEAMQALKEFAVAWQGSQR